LAIAVQTEYANTTYNDINHSLFQIFSGIWIDPEHIPHNNIEYQK